MSPSDLFPTVRNPYNTVCCGAGCLPLPGAVPLRRSRATVTPCSIVRRPRHTNGHHDELTVYLEAEEHGRLDSDCGAVYSACPVSMFTQVAPGSVEFETA